MTITVELNAEVEQRLAEAAKAAGLSEGDFLASLVERSLPKPSGPPAGESAEEWIQRFHQWAELMRSDAPTLSDYAVSRESIYEDDFKP